MQLISDPWSPFCAAFCQHSRSTDRKHHHTSLPLSLRVVLLVYIFNPASFTPVAIYGHIINGGVYGALFRKRSCDDLSLPTWLRQSELLFLSSKQVSANGKCKL